MRLLFVHQFLGALGGAESTLLLAAARLRERGHEVGLLYSRSTGQREEEWTAIFGSDTYKVPGQGNIEHSEAILSTFNPDTLFLHNVDDLDLLETLLDWHVPTVRMVHDHSLYCMRQYKYNYFTREICNRPASGFCIFPCLANIVRNREGILPIKLASYSKKLRELELNRRCDRFLVYSDYCRQELIRNGFNEERIFQFIPVRPCGERPTSSFSEKNLIVFAGQIIRGKGVDVLLRALAKLQVPFQCAIMGDGNHRTHCERLARKLGVSGKVNFTGFLSPAKMRAYYLEASVVAVSSVWPEPFGLVGPEAMQFGLPVVAFDAGGIKEWLEHNETGFLVPWMDVEAYAAALERLLRDKSLARTMGEHGRERVARDFDLESQLEHLEKVFTNLVGTSVTI